MLMTSMGTWLIGTAVQDFISDFPFFFHFFLSDNLIEKKKIQIWI
jgi:hypothetical protein